MSFKVFTVGWEPSVINTVAVPVSKQTGFMFIHGLVGDASRVEIMRNLYPDLNLVALSKKEKDALPEVDISLLAKLESVGVPTIRSAIQGDRVLRYLPANESLGYATLIAKKIWAVLEERRPNVVLASNDSLHSAISLAVAKLFNIPWVALSCTTIPNNLLSFTKALTPNSLVPIARQLDDQILNIAKKFIQSARSKALNFPVFHAPYSLAQHIKRYFVRMKDIIDRAQPNNLLGVDRFLFRTTLEGLFNTLRRSVNRLRLPTDMMLTIPPKDDFVYYPLHMAPESSVDTWAPFYQNQLEFIKQVSLSIPINNVFVIKLHFSDPDNYSYSQLMQLMKRPRMYIVRPDVPASLFIKKASLVIGITGTACLEAALLGKPVLIFGDSPYVHFPRSERAKRPDELYEQIIRMVKQPTPDDTDILKAYATYLARYVSDFQGKYEDIDNYVECFKALAHYLDVPQNRENWYNQPPFVNIK